MLKPRNIIITLLALNFLVAVIILTIVPSVRIELSKQDRAVAYDRSSDGDYLPSKGSRHIPKQRTYPARRQIVFSQTGSSDSDCGVIGGSNMDPLCHEDKDADGVVAMFDCDDNNDKISPYVFDIHCDGIDQNCNGYDECDADKDGLLSQWDCDDNNAIIRHECRDLSKSERLILH